MHDTVQILGKSVIQHGAYNRRIYLMKLHPPDLPDLLFRLDSLAREQGYQKILARIQGRHQALFRTQGPCPLP